MDSLYWKKLVPEIEITAATKLFFKQYVYRLELRAYAGQTITKPAPIEETLAYRKISMRQINYGGSWAIRSKQNVKNADVEWLKYLQRFKQNPSFECKVRVEEPNVQIYCENEEDLYSFVQSMPGDYQKYVLRIAGPESDAAKKIILSGKKIQKKPPAYKFKISFRDGSYNEEVRSSVLNYLDSLDNLVRIPSHFREAFTRPYNSIWDCYIYTNDVKIATFIQLVNPNLVRSIIETAVVEEINTSII